MQAWCNNIYLSSEDKQPAYSDELREALGCFTYSGPGSLGHSSRLLSLLILFLGTLVGITVVLPLWTKISMNSASSQFDSKNLIKKQKYNAFNSEDAQTKIDS